jgi:N-acetylneuraminic acid mutarotase
MSKLDKSGIYLMAFSILILVTTTAGCAAMFINSYPSESLEFSATIHKVLPSQKLNNLSSVSFTVIFSEAIEASSFTSDDVGNAGTAEGVDWTITEISDNTIFQISLLGSPEVAGSILPKITAGSVLTQDGRVVAETVANDDQEIQFKQNAWADLSAMGFSEGSAADPTRRQGFRVTTIGSKIYLFGGRDGISYMQDLHVFDTEANAWSEIISFTGSAPPGRLNHTATVIGEKIYIFAGIGVGGTDLQDLHVYDTETNSWTQVSGFTGTVPPVRAGHSAATINGKLYIFGGINYLDYVDRNDLHVYDPVANSWTLIEGYTGSPPSERYLHSASVIDGKLYIFGGYDTFDIDLQDMHVYDPLANSWANITGSTGPSSHGGLGQGSGVIDGKIYLFGGYDSYGDVQFLQNLHVYDPALNSWSEITEAEGTFPSARESAGATVVSGKLYILGGSSEEGIQQDMHIYFP